MNGVLVDYWLPAAPSGPARLEFLDAKGNVARSFTSATPARTAADTATGPSPNHQRVEAYRDTLAWAASDSLVHVRPGFNRFTWNLEYPSAKEVRGVVTDVGTGSGPTAPPGRYTVRLTVDGKTYEQPFDVVEDPRTGASTADLQAQFDLVSGIVGSIDAIVDAVKRIDTLEGQLDGWKERTAGRPDADSVARPAAALRDSLEAVRGQLVCVHCHADEITLLYPIRLYNQLLSLNLQVVPSHTRPTDQVEAVYRELRGKLDAQLQRLDAIEKGPVADLNRRIQGMGLPPIGAP